MGVSPGEHLLFGQRRHVVQVRYAALLGQQPSQVGPAG
jgi:hypothetical protein